MEHDKTYDAFGAKGANSLFWNGMVGPADYKFVYNQMKLGGSLMLQGITTSSAAYNGYLINESLKSFGVGIGIFLITIPKVTFNNPYRNP